MKFSAISLISLAVCLTPIVACCANVLGGRPAEEKEEPNVLVPKLVGTRMDTVFDRLQSTDLEAAASNIYGDSGWGDDDNVVVSTKPAAGTSVDRYSTVAITYASKAELSFYSKPMPNLEGRQWVKVQDSEPHAVFIYADVTYRDARGSEKPGSVISQSPAKGAKLKLGARIKLKVANEVYPDTGSGSGSGSVGGGPNLNWPNPCRRTKWC